MKFPKLIHVTREEDENYLVAYEDGVASIEEAGTPIAIYELVKIGEVHIEKAFNETPSRRKAK